MEKLEALLDWGGTRKDVACLVLGGAALLASLFDWLPLPFDPAWIAIVLCGVPIVLEAVIGLVTAFDIKADVLVSLALIASVCIGEDFAAGEVAFIMQLGGLLEDLTVAKARAGIEKLVHLTPRTARVLSPAGEKVVPAEEVQVGDLLQVRPGETVPVDGVITSGQTSINQAVMTGATDRAATDVLMGLHGLIDVLVPRGGAGLIRHCVETAKIPVIETGTGNCHVYVHESADFDMAREILVNAKCRRFGVCNACETLLVDESVAAEFLPKALSELADRGVAIHADELACEAALAAGALRGQGQSALRVDRASEQDWETEYLGPEIAVKCVAGVDEAIAHVNRYGTMHSEAIVANPSEPEGAAAIERFLNEVDAAAVYANASTAFTDGGMFGLGAEIGISTQKLHVRGPFATDGLTSYKYVLRGDGQVRF